MRKFMPEFLSVWSVRLST